MTSLLIFCMDEECAPSSGQASNLLLAFVCTGSRYHIFHSFETICLFSKGRPHLRRVAPECGQVFALTENSLKFQSPYTAALTRKATVPREKNWYPWSLEAPWESRYASCTIVDKEKTRRASKLMTTLTYLH
jgi:hypothetical protein